MKRLFAVLLAVMLVASMATVVSAENTTTLTTTVPAATYTLNIPADQEIPFGVEHQEIGKLSVTNANGFAEGKNLAVTVAYTAFSCENTSTTIPFGVRLSFSGTAGGLITEMDIASGASVTFLGKDTGAVEQYAREDGTTQLDVVSIISASEDWGKALAGDYTATITFTAEVVVE